MPIGASLMTHHSAFWTSSSTDRASARAGSAFSPAARAAAPSTAPRKTICRTLTSVKAVTTLVGRMPVTKSSQVPACSGALAAPVSRVTPRPGSMSRPSPMARATDTAAVIRNHISVLAASLAAPLTLRRLATLTSTAVRTSGGTASLSSWTKIWPTLLRVSASQVTSQILAAKPSATPAARPVRSWSEKENLFVTPPLLKGAASR